MPRQPGNCGFVWLDGWMDAMQCNPRRQAGWLAGWHTTTLLVSYLNGRTGMWPSFASVSRCRVSRMYNFITGRQYVRSTIHIGPLGILGSKSQKKNPNDIWSKDQTDTQTYVRSNIAGHCNVQNLFVVGNIQTHCLPTDLPVRSNRAATDQQSVMKKYVQMR